MEKFDRYDKWYYKWENLIDMINDIPNLINMINDITNGKIW